LPDSSACPGAAVAGLSLLAASLTASPAAAATCRERRTLLRLVEGLARRTRAVLLVAAGLEGAAAVPVLQRALVLRAS